MNLSKILYIDRYGIPHHPVSSARLGGETPRRTSYVPTPRRTYVPPLPPRTRKSCHPLRECFTQDTHGVDDMSCEFSVGALANMRSAAAEGSTTSVPRPCFCSRERALFRACEYLPHPVWTTALNFHIRVGVRWRFWLGFGPHKPSSPLKSGGHEKSGRRAWVTQATTRLGRRTHGMARRACTLLDTKCRAHAPHWRAKRKSLEKSREVSRHVDIVTFSGNHATQDLRAMRRRVAANASRNSYLTAGVGEDGPRGTYWQLRSRIT